MNDHRKSTITKYKNGNCQEEEQLLIVEEPLSIRIEGAPYSVVMRTPGDEISHVAGFCLAEGLVNVPEDIITIGFCAESDTNVATVTLTEARKKEVASLIERKGFVSQTSCGICGKEVIKDLHQIIKPAKKTFQITPEQTVKCTEMLPSYQQLHQKTRSAHASLILDKDLQVLSFAEDVGRHNALDKAIGKVFMDNRISSAVLGIMSSRLSYELIQKAARAGLEILVGISRPTALGVDLALANNMTLACFKNENLIVYCHKDRIINH